MYNYTEMEMTDLLAAADVSGNPIEGNYKYMGLVIGTKENLDAISKRLKLDQFSSNRRIKDKGVRKSLVSKLEFNCRENIQLTHRWPDNPVNAVTWPRLWPYLPPVVTSKPTICTDTWMIFCIKLISIPLVG